MKKIIALLVFAATFSGVSAQTSGQVATYTTGATALTDGLVLNALGSISDKLDKLEYSDSSIEGSPYMSNTFAPGQLYYGDEAVGNIFYRHNAYNEEIEIKQTNSEAASILGLSKDKNIRLVVNGKSTSFKTIVDRNGNTKNAYLTLLADGDYKLYKHLEVVFKEAKKAENSFVTGSPAKFTQFTEYFLEKPDAKRIDQIELNTKKFIQCVGKDELKSFLKENKIKLKSESDLIKAVDFLNNL